MWVFVLILSNLGQYGGIDGVQVGPFETRMMCEGARTEYGAHFNEPRRIARADTKSAEHNVLRYEDVMRTWMLTPCVQISVPPPTWSPIQRISLR